METLPDLRWPYEEPREYLPTNRLSTFHWNPKISNITKYKNKNDKPCRRRPHAKYPTKCALFALEQTEWRDRRRQNGCATLTIPFAASKHPKNSCREIVDRNKKITL